MEWNKVMRDMHLLNFLRDPIEIKMYKWAMEQKKGHINCTGSNSNIKKNNKDHIGVSFQIF